MRGVIKFCMLLNVYFKKGDAEHGRAAKVRAEYVKWSKEKHLKFIYNCKQEINE